MSNLSATAAAAFPVFVQGMALSLGLIVAIGAQNAFVLRQGLRGERVGPVVAFCAAGDASRGRGAAVAQAAAFTPRNPHAGP